jgi:hypothetical protein
MSSLSIQEPEPSHWILGCKNVWAQIVARPDLEEEHFADGAYDDHRVVVLTVLDLSNGGPNYLTSTANVRFMEGSEQGTNRAIPIQYLNPILPLKAKEKVMATAGPYKGKVFEAQSITEDSIWASPVDGGDPQMLDRDSVVKYHEWNE